MKILTRVLLLNFILLISILDAEALCPNNINCKIIYNNNNEEGKITPHTMKECTLPNMPTLPITAEDVFNSDGSLHNYFGFGAKNVCDVLGWMNNSVSHLDNFEGLKNDITTPLSLKFKHLYKSTGGTTIKTAISLDSDTYKVNTDNENDKLPDGNRHIYRMKYITVHEFLHFISYNSVRKGDFWVAEGTVPTYDELIHILNLDGEDTYRYEIFEHLGAVGYWSLDRNGGVFPDSELARVVNFGLATWIWINTSSQINTRCVRTK